MKGMGSAKEYWQAPPAGKYLSKCTAAEATVSKAGASMLKLDWEIREPKEHAGATATDYIITDGGAKGGGMGKKKLRGLGINVDSDEEIPDSVLAQQLLGLECWVEYLNEPQMTESVKGSKKYDKPVTAFDTQLGKEIQINKLVVDGYFRHNVGGGQAQAQGAVAQGIPAGAPQGFTGAPAGYAPQQGAPQQGFYPQQGFVPGAPTAAPGGMPPGYPQQGFVPQGAPQGYAPQGYAPQGGPAQGFVPGQAQGFVPQGFVPNGAPPVTGAPPAAAVPPWIAAQQGQAAAPEAGEGEGGGKKRGKKA